MEQVAKLTPSDGAADDSFGTSLACSGAMAVIGASHHAVEGRADQGAVYVFTRTDQGWTQNAELNASDGSAGDLFGFFVDVDRDTIVAGALHADVAGAEQGAAYVFVRSGAAWIQQAKLTAADGAAGDDFGAPVIIQGDLALIGACAKDVGANVGQGAAYAFARSGTRWSQEARLTAADGAGDEYFATRMALLGQTAIVGAPWRDVAGKVDQGSAFVFVRSGTTWTQKAELTAADGSAHDRFGLSVSLGRGAALIGAPSHDIGATLSAGSAYLFTGSGTSWEQRAAFTASDVRPFDYFGNSACLEGETALIGAPSVDGAATPDWGSAYLFDLGSAPTTKAVAASVKAGNAVRLGYTIMDAVPSSGSAVATIEIRKGVKVVKRIQLGVRRMNAQLRYRYKAKLKPGAYTWRVKAMDLARHGSTKMVAARLTIK